MYIYIYIIMYILVDIITTMFNIGISILNEINYIHNGSRIILLSKEL